MHSTWDLPSHTCFSSSHLTRKPPVWRVLKPINLHITLALATLTGGPVYRTPKPANTSASDVRPGHLCRERPRTPGFSHFSFKCPLQASSVWKALGQLGQFPFQLQLSCQCTSVGSTVKHLILAPPQDQQPCQGDLYQRAPEHPSLCSLQLKPSCWDSHFAESHKTMPRHCLSPLIILKQKLQNKVP